MPRRPLVPPLLPAGLLAMLGLWHGWTHAQTPGLQLRSSPSLQENLSAQERQQGSMYMDAARVDLRPDMDVVLEGDAVIRRPGMVIRADRIEYDQTRDRVKAEGGVRLNQQGILVTGPSADLQIDSMQGRFETPQYRLVQGGHGDAREIEFIDDHRMAVHQARYTTCRATPGPEWLPEWFLQAARIGTDAAEGTGVAQDVQLHLFGLTSPTIPEVAFSLESQRSSGLLAPLLSIDSLSGLDLMQPYYWDIAPNRDATLITRAMSKRGFGFEGEFRYLESHYSGQARLNWLPHDALRGESRWGLTTSHSGYLDTGVPEIGRIGTTLSINRVSDDLYWRDFPRTYFGSGGQVGGGFNQFTGIVGQPGAGFGLTQRILPSTGSLSWERDGWSMAGLVQRWQTQQDVTLPITPPYDRAPQLTLRYGRWNDNGLDWSVTGETTRFEADFSGIPAANRPPFYNGTRSYTQAQISRPWVAPWGFITPKVQLHATRYDLLNPLSDGSTTVNRVLPTFSLDGGLLFERDTTLFGRGLTQTLEPRIFYVRTPYADQGNLPLYDTGLTDFSLATIYRENPYVGQDRIADNNVMTFGVNSRFFDSTNGSELLRLGVAQRLRFSDQRVTLNPNTAADQKGLSDLLLAVGTRWTDQLSSDVAFQINNLTHEVQRSTVQTRYNPGPYRLLNAAYRLNKDPVSPSELIDLGWQWPLSDLRWGDRPDDSGVRAYGQGLGSDRWYGVGRLNYSLQDKQMVNALVGFEYDAGCWLGRVVFERLQNTLTASNTRLMFQIELVGFGRIGVSPLDALRNNIPRYQFLRDSSSTPSRFLQYE